MADDVGFAADVVLPTLLFNLIGTPKKLTAELRLTQLFSSLSSRSSSSLSARLRYLLVMIEVIGP